MHVYRNWIFRQLLDRAMGVAEAARCRGMIVPRAFLAGRAERLPFGDRSFDRTIAGTSLCLIRPEREALREIVRVTRKRASLGLLNRGSLLYLQKGRHGGSGGYRGAHWHTRVEALFDGMPVRNIAVRGGVLVPTGGCRLQAIFQGRRLPLGAFLLAVADIRS